MVNFLQKSKPEGVKHLVVVSSGKGGVGKSTVAANLAIMLASKGYKTALLDADIYGPSAPKIFGIENIRPEIIEKDGKEMMMPIEKYGVKVNSVGLIVDPNQAVIWRAPLAGSALAMLFNQTIWGEIDYMIIDFPPGTGDIQISTLQQYNISAAIAVTTPQVIAVNDVRKGMDMFSPEKMNVPLLGIVENMSWFTPMSHPDEKYFLFGQGGGEQLAKEFGTPLLAQIPIIQEVGKTAEAGGNLIAANIPEINILFSKLAEELVYQLSDVPEANLSYKIAVPTVDGRVDDHFGHCDHYTLFEIDEHDKVVATETLPAGQGCGCKSNIASVLQQKGVKVMLAGNMGEGAKNVLNAAQIMVIRGCSGDVNVLVQQFLEGKISDSGVGCAGHDHECGHQSHSCGNH